jgi:hypothetical protein
MAQCFHLDSRGRRCGRETDDGAYFCDEHAPAIAPQPLAASLRRWGLRLAALLLLAVFVLPLVVQVYRFLRAMLN